MRVWFDTEFIEDGKTIELLSIGLVREDQITLYLENAEADHSRADSWVEANVLPKLSGGPFEVSRDEIAQRVFEFVGPHPEFWAWYADYDWVALCQLYGRMVDLPHSWPMYCRDFKQLVDDRGWSVRKLEHGAHNALHDALWLHREHLRLDGCEHLWSPSHGCSSGGPCSWCQRCSRHVCKHREQAAREDGGLAAVLVFRDGVTAYVNPIDS